MHNRLYLSKDDKIISGVCGGIAEHLQVDPTIIRLLWVFMSLVYGAGLILYIIASIIIPKKPEEIVKIDLSKESDQRPDEEENKAYINTADENKNRQMGGYALIIIGLILITRMFPFFRWITFTNIMPIILIGAGIVILINSYKK